MLTEEGFILVDYTELDVSKTVKPVIVQKLVKR